MKRIKKKHLKAIAGLIKNASTENEICTFAKYMQIAMKKKY